MRNLFYCLNCNNRFLERNPGAIHRCGNCGSSAIVSQDDLRRGGMALKGPAYHWLFHDKGETPPPPPPNEVIEFPVNVAALFSVMSKAKTINRRTRAAELMLIEAGFPEDSAKDLARKMHP
jgi:predicted RNA-binding Zn-ribbon protein involved in translation (DUF1610 family)